MSAATHHASSTKHTQQTDEVLLGWSDFHLLDLCPNPRCLDRLCASLLLKTTDLLSSRVWPSLEALRDNCSLYLHR